MGQITKLCRVFFSFGGVYSSKYGLYYALGFRYVNYGCVLWGNNYLAPISQLVKLQNEVVRNAKNVMTFWPCNFSPFICEPWSNIVKLNTCQLKYIFIITPYIKSRLISSCPLYMSNIMTQGSAFIQHLNPSTFRIDN